MPMKNFLQVKSLCGWKYLQVKTEEDKVGQALSSVQREMAMLATRAADEILIGS